MPQIDHFPFPHRYNTLRLLGYDYSSIDYLCALTLVTDARRPLFADTLLAKRVLTCLLSDATLQQMSVRAFTLMPDHLHLIARAHDRQSNLARVTGQFKSFTTQLYWKRSREIVVAQQVSLPSGTVRKDPYENAGPLLAALGDYRATLRPEVVDLKNWPKPVPHTFRGKRLWQEGFFDHVIRNDRDLLENLRYIAMNPVRAGYVTHPGFYPYTGFH